MIQIAQRKHGETKKKVLTSIHAREELKRRKSLTSAAMNKYNQIWISKGKTKIKDKTKLTIYKTLEKPILTYKSSTCGLTIAEYLKIDAF